MRLRLAWLCMALGFSGTCWAQSYPYFPPPGIGYSATNGNLTLQNMTLESVTGIVLCDGSSGLCSAASSANVVSLWVGTPSSTLFLRSDGQLALAGAGTVTDVITTVPAPLTATGCNITVSGTCAITWTGGQTANQFLATPNGTTGPTGLRSIVLQDLPSGVALLTSGVTTFQSAGNTQLFTEAGTSGAVGRIGVQTIGGTNEGAICVSDIANTCEGSIPANYTDLAASAGLQVTVGGVPQMQSTATTFSLPSYTTLTGNQICLANGTNCPLGVITMNLTSTGATAPTITNCNRCVSPSAARISTGIWQITTGVTLSTSMVALCNESAAGIPAGQAVVISAAAADPSAQIATLNFRTNAGVVQDPTAGIIYSCVVGL